MSDIWMTVAEPTLTFEQRTEAENGRFVEPSRYQLYSDRQLLRAECERYRPGQAGRSC